MERIPLSQPEPRSDNERNRRAHERLTAALVATNTYLPGPGQRTLRLAGVKHQYPTFEYYREEIEKIIETSTAVLLEGYVRKETPENIPHDFPSESDVRALREELARLQSQGTRVKETFKRLESEYCGFNTS